MKHQRGFTLLEMLAALTLMAVGSTVLLVAFGQSARSLAQVARSDRLTHAALTVLDQEASGPLTEGVSQGELEGVHWQLTRTRQPPHLFRLDLRVSEGSHQARFSTLKARL
ncbi:type II secretion system protein [Pseudomonas tolaasii]|uniref:Type II secretion system protein n=2 Tax=Pseudomonas tolaasii TaxID=29442 RepID=A0A7Y8AM56_PSETO|nr:type II secretion system protein [Pseudomonas tolaasii]ARB29579.1 general secretion pathway protein GspI [Pseudomonas tolaasii]KAB0478226.1 type II secretion system protein [Pseudomonas tolaasii]MBW1246512.1 type II secretion system protein [Pseudomonas tolaasii]MBW4793345.1 type II secretion system protein [Pseudomonas tolaasii]MBY8942907.1 type II secretion system protein [Pseudomonas tolaasii]